MEQGTCCPVCTLYLRPGITLQAHLDTHPKDKVIEALLKVTNANSAAQTSHLAEGFAHGQPYAPSNTGFVSQTQNYVNPQTQVTAAVTYQQFVTSNGSAVVPQYIQVPALVAPNNSTSGIPNQALTYVPNQPSAYAPTMYNPLYNPYIPQPYPLVQPVYTNMPATHDSSSQLPTSQISNPSISSSNTQSAVSENSDTLLKQVSSVATNTSSKNVTLKTKSKKLPVRSAAQTKFRITKQLGSRTKTTTATLATLATKSYRITGINGGMSAASKAAATAKGKLRIKTRPLLPRTSLSSASNVKTPLPLTPVSRSRSSSMSGTSPSPPQSPCPTPIENVSFESRVFSADKNCRVRITEPEDSNSKPEILGKNKNNEKVTEYMVDRQEATPANTVITESNSAIQITSNILISSTSASENKGELNCENERILSHLPPHVEGGSFLRDQQPELSGSNICGSFGRDPFENEQDCETDFDEEEIPDKVFHSFEIKEEKKVAFSFDLENHEMRQGVHSADRGKNFGESDIFTPEESAHSGVVHDGTAKDIEFTRNSATTPQDDSLSLGRRRGSSVIFLGNANVTAVAPSVERAAQVGEFRNFGDRKSVSYTDLQPATNSKVLQDFGITTSYNLNNCMEVEGIKIYFNNGNMQNIPLEPIIKFTSNLKSDMAKVQNYMKSGNESEALVESVIHLVSGTTQKSDFNGETFHNSNSDNNADLRDLSPLTLNIRADESMPARGELSEQESLGAENSNWGLFHSEIQDVKTQEELRSGTDFTVSVLNCENGVGTSKPFDCSLCPEVFPSLKDRRLQRTTVNEKSVTRRPKVFTCTQCKEKFTSLKDRRRHVMQNHFYEPKNDKTELKSETRDENELTNLNQDVTESTMAIKFEDDAIMKSESFVGGQNIAEPMCGITRNCPGCELPFTGSKKLKEHLKEVHGESKYKCGTCSQIFGTDREYNSHLRIHPLECNQCGKLFNRKPNLKLHLRRHLLVKPYACTQCPKSFITRQKLDEHLNGHSGIKPLKCMSCDRTFSRHSNLIQHRNTHHVFGKKKVKDFVCRCGEVFHSIRKLEWHKEVHDTKPKTCPFCSQKFIHRNSVTRHIRRSHIPHYLPSDKKDAENVQCPVCGKICLRSSLLVHMRVHNGEKPFVCKICSKSFTTKWNLELHNWTHQSRNNMPFKCTICKSAFYREVDYVAHSNSHRNFRPFTCNICGQKFIRKYNCLRHQDEHKKEKKYVCSVSGCEKSFHRSYYLRDHMRVHTGVRPHTCHICGKASSTKSNHNKHIRIHDTREPLNTEN